MSRLQYPARWIPALLMGVAIWAMPGTPAHAQRENTGQQQRGRYVDPNAATATPATATPATAQRPRSAAAPAPAASSGGQVVYVKRDDVTLRSGATRTAGEVKSLSLGEALTVIGTEGVQYHVRTTDGRTGYVAKLNVSDTAPRTQTGRGRVLVADDLGPNERANVSSIRGLSADAENLVQSGQASEEALQDVKKMEQISESISEAEIDKFMKDGEVIPL